MKLDCSGVGWWIARVWQKPWDQAWRKHANLPRWRRQYFMAAAELNSAHSNRKASSAGRWLRTAREHGQCREAA